MVTTKYLVRASDVSGLETVSFLHLEGPVNYRVQLPDTKMTMYYRTELFEKFKNMGWDYNSSVNRISKENITPRQLLKNIFFINSFGMTAADPPRHNEFKDRNEVGKYIAEIFAFSEKATKTELMNYSEKVSLQDISPFLKGLGFKPGIFPRPPAIGGKKKEITYEMIGL